MEMVADKIDQIGSHKNNLIDIFSVGQKIHDVVNACGDNCGCYNYLSEINDLMENMTSQQTSAEKNVKIS